MSLHLFQTKIKNIRLATNHPSKIGVLPLFTHAVWKLCQPTFKKTAFSAFETRAENQCLSLIKHLSQHTESFIGKAHSKEKALDFSI